VATGLGRADVGPIKHRDRRLRRVHQLGLIDQSWNAGQIGRRIQAQWPVTRKLEQATFGVWSEGTLEVLAEQLRRVLQNAGKAPGAKGSRR
jgi:dephospho-CoA kinase